VFLDEFAESRERSTLLLFPGLGGDDREFSALRAGCAPLLRCVTVEYPDWTEMYARSIDLDGLIAHCIERVNTLVPHGELRLVGYSFGGQMAYTVAAALAASGRTIAQLGLLDCSARPNLPTAPPSMDKRWRRFCTAIRERDVHREFGRLTAGVVMRSRNAWLLRSAVRMRHVKLPLNMHEHIAGPFTCRFREPLLHELIGRMAVDETRLDVPTVLFRCTEQPNADAAHDLGWGRHLRHVRVVPVSGTHATVINLENMTTLCEAVVDAMAEDKAEDRGGSQVTRKAAT
jgi:thioesterase domain-containing protein